MEQTQAGDHRWPRNPSEPPYPPSVSDFELPAPHPAEASGFRQMFGLHPAIAALTLCVDTMLFGGEAASLGTSLPFSIAGGIILGIIAYRAQMKWYGDDKESALIKGLILGFLTAIPTPLPALVYVPAGIVGLFRRKK